MYYDFSKELDQVAKKEMTKNKIYGIIISEREIKKVKGNFQKSKNKRKTY